MVKLKRCEMSVLKNITIRIEDYPVNDVWIAIMKTAVAFNCLNSIYDGFYYKDGIVISQSNKDKDQLCVQFAKAGKPVILKFGSQSTMDEFCKFGNCTPGTDCPCPSPVSSVTPSPPKSTPSLRARSSSSSS